MKKFLVRIMACSLVVIVCWSTFLIADRRKLNSGLIRFHVVAHSDSNEDQAIKRNVRDAILNSIQSDIQNLQNIDEAREYLLENLPKLKRIADQTLEELGFSGKSHVTLCKEQFEIRHYDTFSLPAGIYDSLRIVIGDGLGENWWCVSFPTLCIPATTSGFTEVAVDAGFPESLVQTLAGNEGYEIRFFFLNQLGKLQNIFFQE